MSKKFVGSIDLNKIDKKRIVTKDREGNPFKNGAKYLPIILWVNDEIDQYGYIASIQESISKEEADNGIKSTYLGNLKNSKGQNVSSNSEAEKTEPEKTAYQEYEDDLPF